MNMGVCPVTDGFEPFSPAYFRDPYPFFNKLRHYCLGAPLARSNVHWFLEATHAAHPRMRLLEGQSMTHSPNVLIRVPEKLLVQPMGAEHPH
jgi:hypothetical protein